jgi:hypothetical protein
LRLPSKKTANFVGSGPFRRALKKKAKKLASFGRLPQLGVHDSQIVGIGHMIRFRIYSCGQLDMAARFLISLLFEKSRGPD